MVGFYDSDSKLVGWKTDRFKHFRIMNSRKLPMPRLTLTRRSCNRTKQWPSVCIWGPLEILIYEYIHQLSSSLKLDELVYDGEVFYTLWMVKCIGNKHLSCTIRTNFTNLEALLTYSFEDCFCLCLITTIYSFELDTSHRSAYAHICSLKNSNVEKTILLLKFLRIPFIRMF